MIRKNILLALLFGTIVMASSQLHGQSRFHQTIYWMRGIPQSSYSNPALFTDPGFYVGVPGLSSGYLNMANRGFKPGDLVMHDLNNELYWNNENLVEEAARQNMIHAEASIEVFALGYRKNKSQVSFNITDKASFQTAFTGDFLRLFVMGSEHFGQESRSANFDGLAFDMGHYREYALGYARQLTPFFSFGLRGRVLFGLSNIMMEYNDMHLMPGPAGSPTLVGADLIINSSNTSVRRYLKNTDDDYYVLDTPQERFNYMTNMHNGGLAFDMGMVVRATPSLTLAASLLDMGYINWKHKLENYHVDGATSYDGIDLQDLFQGSFPENFLMMTDTLGLAFYRTETTEGYRQRLSPTATLSAALKLSNRHMLALTSQGLFYKEVIYPSMGVSYHANLSHALGLALSYSVVHMNYANIGFGMNLNLGPLQLYVVSDNVMGHIIPFKSQMANIHAGINLVFGYKPAPEAPVSSGI